MRISGGVRLLEKRLASLMHKDVYGLMHKDVYKSDAQTLARLQVNVMSQS